MKNMIIWTLLLVTMINAQLFINEIDYDQPGTDSGEFIEIAGLAGTYTNVSIELVNGNNGSIYSTTELGSVVLSDQINGYGFYTEYIAGIQNGAPDGVQLKINGNIVDAVSYEGQMNDTDGNAMEEATPSDDDPYWEGGEGLSIGRLGLDNSPWIVMNITPGLVNEGQAVSNTPGLFITSPVDASTIYTNNIDIEFNLLNFIVNEDGYINYSVDGGSTVTYYSFEPIALSDLETGSHTVNLWLVDIDLNDLDPPVVDQVTFTVSTVSTVSIYDIQGQTDSSPYADQIISTTGIVTAVGSYYYWLQDGVGGWNGLYVYAGDNHGVQLGDSITITGEVVESYDQTRMEDIINQVIHSSGNTLPTSATITTTEVSSEMYEGVLVSVINAECINPDLGYGEWEVDDGSGSCIVDDKMFEFNAESGTHYNVTGPVEYSYSNYKIEPRNENDVQIYTIEGAPIANAGVDQFVEINSIVTLDGSGSLDDGGFIVGYLWEQLSGISVVLSDYEESVVTFTAPGEATTLEFQLTVIDNDAQIATDNIIVTVGSTTIYDVQFAEELGTDNDCYPSTFDGETVTVTGVVTAVKPGTDPNFYLQDSNLNNWAGIYVYDTSVNPIVGDEVTLTAEVDEYYGLTELKNVADYTINQGTNSVEPLNISTGDLGLFCGMPGEQYEGMLVNISGVIDSTNEYNSWYIDDGSGTTKVDDYFFNGEWTIPLSGDNFNSIIGVVHYFYGEYVIYPRNGEDIHPLLSVDETKIPTEFALVYNYPNPFNPVTTISYELPMDANVKIAIHNIVGQKVAELVNNWQSRGQYEVKWNGKNMSGNSVTSGVYFYTIHMDNNIITNKMVLMK